MSDREEQRFGIGTVARMTGLTDHTIRVWERRYEAVVAERADNGRRQYSEKDVEKLSLLKRLTDEGVAISQIAGLNTDELRSRSNTLRHMHEQESPADVNAAVLGDFLPSQLSGVSEALSPVHLVVADSSRERFTADLKRQQPDVIVLESSVLDPDTPARLQELMRDANAAAGVIYYKFAARRDVERARDLGIYLLRAPSDLDSIRSAILRAAASAIGRTKREPAIGPAAPGSLTATPPEVTEEVPPRRFTTAQIAKLSRISTAIDCECPSQLTELINALSAFEVYSDSCANRNEDDEKLHRYLHFKSAQARAVIEEALEQVGLAEGLSA